MIQCKSIKGNIVDIPKEKLVFRPSIYGVIPHEGKILMLNCKSNGKLFFPGGSIELGEKMFDALKREVREETGIEIEIGKFLHFKEHFFYYDPTGAAFQMFNVFYICKPTTFALVDDDKVNDDECEKPRWIDIEKIKNNVGNQETVSEIFNILKI